jgi:cell division transport system permease protein
MSIPYSFRVAISSLLHEKWINFLSMLTMAIGLLFTAITLLTVYNIDLMTKKLPEKFSIMLYLKDSLAREEIDTLIEGIRQDPTVDRVLFIPKDEAFRELKATLRNTEYILDGLGENPLPNSIEIKLKAQLLGPESVKKLTAKLKGQEGISEIEYGEKFLASLHSVRKGMNTIGLVFLIVLSAGMIFICYSTVKILFYRKDEEIKTYKLLGATKGFIRTPFLIEGAVIGTGGGLISFITIISFYYTFIFNLSQTFPLLNSMHFPLELFLALPAAGLLIGIAGAIIAIGRIRY